jgi:hypothetical protein
VTLRYDRPFCEAASDTGMRGRKRMMRLYAITIAQLFTDHQKNKTHLSTTAASTSN